MSTEPYDTPSSHEADREAEEEREDNEAHIGVWVHDVCTDKEVEHAAAEPACEEAEAARDPLGPVQLQHDHEHAEECVPQVPDNLDWA